MSLSSKKSALAVRSRASFDNLEESLFEWGYQWKNGKLIDLGAGDDRALSEWEVKEIKSQNLTDEQMKDLLKNKSRGAKYIAWRFRKPAYNSGFPSMEEVCSDWAALKDIRRWMSQQNPDDLVAMSLATKYWREEGWNDAGYHHDAGYVYKFEPHKLVYLGIRFAWQAERFAQLYEKVCTKGRPWGSCYQPTQAKVRAIALTPNYNKLPLWVKKVLVESPHRIQEEDGRVGNIWRLVSCAKAWKWCNTLPKGIAEKVGRMSVRSRILAKVAWSNINDNYNKSGWVGTDHHSLRCDSYYDQELGEYVYTPIDRKATTLKFWEELKRLLAMPILPLLINELWIKNDDQGDGGWHYYRLNHNEARILVEQSLGLPYNFLWEAWGRNRDMTIDKLCEIIATYGSPKEACQQLFGVSGKATVKAFQNSGKNQWKWASNLAYGKADLVQKYLSLPECIDYEPEALEFLKQLGDAPALRMVGTTTFKIRGDIRPLEQFHIKDTGYLWNNIKEKPELGRVRCWLSAHEELARRFVAEQPDEALRVDPLWEQVDGLCAVDGSWQLELPRRTATLKFWGEQLHHCVGGYSPKVNSGDCVIFAVKVNGWVRYTVEMCPDGMGRWDCNQFYGDRNSYAPSNLKSSVLSALYDAELSSDRS